MRLVNALESSDAPLAMGAIVRATLGYHDGWTDNHMLAVDLAALPLTGGHVVLGAAQVLRLYPALANRAMRRELLAVLPEGLSLNGDARAVQVLVLASALAAGGACVTRLPVARTADRPMQPASRRHRALGGRLARNRCGRLAARLARGAVRAARAAARRAHRRERLALAIALAARHGWLRAAPRRTTRPRNPARDPASGALVAPRTLIAGCNTMGGA